MIEELVIPSPPLPEQKAIAAVLGALDDKIELNRRMNATLEAMARALFQSWFVDFDPVRAKLDGRQSPNLNPDTAALFPSSFHDSELGPIPQGWKITKLKDLTSKIGSGATPRGGSEVYVEEGSALIRSQNVYDYEFQWSGLVRLTDKSAKELKNVEVMKNDVLINITGDSILRTCVVDPAVLPARVNQHVAIIRAIQDMPPRYLHLYLVQPSLKSLLMGMSAGATRHAITKGHLEAVNVLHPSVRVLTAFDKLTRSWFDQIDSNRTQSRTLAALRDTLLPKLLSGELSVASLLA
ncbi:MAG: restriction endonuclease [Verrucomicrobiales bacterium]|nr:restriction endonuclease [Verrucomicrobiales bacterium]